MTALVVVEPGPSTTLQDGGRRGSARYGVPRSGPVDVLAHRLAARLAGAAVGDVSTTVAIEVGPHPCVLAAEGGRLPVAVAGAGVRVEVGGSVVAAPCVLELAAGEECTVRSPTWGYVVPAAVVDVPRTLGSRSHHPRSGLGPAVGPGTPLPLHDVRAPRPGRRVRPDLPGGRLRILAAPQTERFTAGALRRLTAGDFRTTAAFDRMGHKLDGPVLATDCGHDIVSDGIVAGSLQVPGDGLPYVLTADHQTTGGYPKVAVLATADLARFVRLVPGTTVRFGWADVPTARARLEQSLAALEAAVDGPVTPLDSALQEANLITGVTDALRDGP